MSTAECSYLEWFYYQVDKQIRMELQSRYEREFRAKVPKCYDMLGEDSDTIPQKDPPSSPDYLYDTKYKVVIKQSDDGDDGNESS